MLLAGSPDERRTSAVTAVLTIRKALDLMVGGKPQPNVKDRPVVSLDLSEWVSGIRSLNGSVEKRSRSQIKRL